MNNPVNMSDPSVNWPSFSKIIQGAKNIVKNVVNTIVQHVVTTVIVAVTAIVAAVGIGIIIKNPRLLPAVTGGGATAAKVSSKSGGNLSKGGQGTGSASNAANAVRLKAQLTYQEASSVFTKSGTLYPNVVENSRKLILGSGLKNIKVIEALTADGGSISNWAKMSTPTFRSPSGNFQVHFYKNLENR
ncbi:MAG: Basic proline-rich protein [Clostridiaceae bacterium]|jgi:hypothetical protein|nr:Basic proline-rich protein [Clostridiaceae bacterium]